MSARPRRSRSRSARRSPWQEELHAEIRGRDLVSGLPKTIVVSTQEIRKAIDEPVSAIIDAVKVTLDKTPPELAADIMEQGIVLTGGGALLARARRPAPGRDGDADHRGPRSAQLCRNRERAVPRGVRGAQASSHHLFARVRGRLAIGARSRRARRVRNLGARSVARTRRQRWSSRPRLVLAVLVLAVVSLITLDVRGGGQGRRSIASKTWASDVFDPVRGGGRRSDSTGCGILCGCLRGLVGPG